LFFLIFPLYLKIRISSIFVISVYIIGNIKGGIAALLGSPAGIGYWAHIGGIAAGIVLALRLQYQDRALEDMYTEEALAAIEEDSGLAKAEEFLRRALQLNPENEAALLALARRESKPFPDAEGRELYQRLIRLLLKTDPKRAAEVFAEYFPIYSLPLNAEDQYRLTPHLQRAGWSSLAAQALREIAVNPAIPRKWAELSLFKLGQILEELRLPDAARFRYRQLLKRYPDFPQRSLVLYRIKKLTNG
jgi:TolA-binding protein